MWFRSWAMHSPMSRPLVRHAAAHAVSGLLIAATAGTLACTPTEDATPTPVASGEAPPTPMPSTAPGEPGPAVEPGEGETGGDPEPAAEAGGAAEAGETGEVEPGEEPGEIIPAAPAGYGVFKFSQEPLSEEELTLHGLAGYEIVAVYAEPNKDSAHLGFLRIGARMRVGKKTVTEDCRKGWYALEGGGWACASRGLVVDTKAPFMGFQPTPARLDQPFPYDWAYVREWNTPMWWQVPSSEALAATREKRAILEAERKGEPPPGSEPAAPAGGGTAGGGEGGDAPLPAPDGEGAGDGGGAEPTPPPAPPTPPPADPTPSPPEEEKEPVKIPLSPSTPWLEKGYFLSLGETLREGSMSYWRTARGGVVEKSKAYPYEAKDYQGAEIHPGMSFPFGFVMAKNGTKLLELGADDKLHATGKTLEKRTFLDLGEEVEVNGQTYFTVLPYPPEDATADANGEAKPDAGGEGGEAEPMLLVKADVMRLADIQPIPKGLEPWDRWVDVDITKQILVAYEGARPVYVTLVSTGKKGSPEEPFDTPTGRYRIYSKQVTSNMDGATATDGNYAIQDVPWVMYFEGSYALHGAFWHTSFGYVRSHGCVNLGPSDARWLFFWTTPFVPPLWHGVTASDDNPGTTVIVRESGG